MNGRTVEAEALMTQQPPTDKKGHRDNEQTWMPGQWWTNFYNIKEKREESLLYGDKFA